MFGTWHTWRHFSLKNDNRIHSNSHIQMALCQLHTRGIYQPINLFDWDMTTFGNLLKTKLALLRITTLGSLIFEMGHRSWKCLKLKINYRAFEWIMSGVAPFVQVGQLPDNDGRELWCSFVDGQAGRCSEMRRNSGLKNANLKTPEKASFCPYTCCMVHSVSLSGCAARCFVWGLWWSLIQPPRPTQTGQIVNQKVRAVEVKI